MTKKKRNPQRARRDPQPAGERQSSLLGDRTVLIGGAVVVILIIAAATFLLSCGGGPATPEAKKGPKQWDAPPAMSIDPARKYFATIKTDVGDVRLELFADQTPKTVNNFVFLARQGFYDNTIFHRVMEDFMAQAGDPTGTGTGGPGYQFEDEIVPGLVFDEPGLLAMANAGPNTNGSQFFITFVPTPWLNGNHTIFGKVVAGMDVLPKIVRRNPQDPNAPPGTKIETIVIEEQ